MIHYPSGKEVYIKNIQSYHEDREIVYATSRIAINLKNIKKDEIKRGHLLCSKDEMVFLTYEIILELIGNSNIEYLKKIKNAEFAIGTECLVAQIIPLYKNQVYNGADKKIKNNTDVKEIDRRFIRLKFDKPIPVFWKERGILISHGGSAIIGTGNVFWAMKTNPNIRKNIMDNAEEFLGNVKRSAYTDLVISINGYSLANENLPNYAIKMSNYFVKKDYLNSILEDAKKLIDSKKEGVSFEDIRNNFNIDNDFAKVFIDYLIQIKMIMPFNSIYQKYNQNVELNSSQKKLLEKLNKEDLNGLEERIIKYFTNGTKDIKVLSALKLAIYLGEGIYYHIDTYNRVKNLIMEDAKSKDIITIGFAKEKTGLSRKYIIPILNTLEREKLLKRQGNDRVVI